MRIAQAALTLAILLARPAAADVLTEYLAKPQPRFSWRVAAQVEQDGGTIYELQVTSQVWHDIPWTHRLHVYRPSGVGPGASMLLYNGGDGPKPATTSFAMATARRVGAPVAYLYDVPNQPLLGGKNEDALVAETLVRAIQTGDLSWALLLPMVKSLTAAMDALQAFSRETWKTPLERFVISGRSKRGWASWLAGAAGDPRIAAIAPMVIDMLDIPRQMDHTRALFGHPSVMIRDYTGRGLIPIPADPMARKVWALVDPFSYLDRITVPKLVVNANDDPYWTLDALNLYWARLRGPAYLAYVPNAGHDLVEFSRFPPPPGATGDRSRADAVLAAFVRAVATGAPLPRLKWTHEANQRLIVTAEPPPRAARLWSARAPTMDFRQARWVGRPLGITGARTATAVRPPPDGFVAYWAELDYTIDGIDYALSTQLAVVGPAR